MYPQRELIRLGVHKAALRRRIGRRRADCVSSATRIFRPVAWLDRLLVLWRRVSPFAGLAAIPFGLLLKRSTAPRPRLFGALLRWTPVVWGALRSLGAPRRR
jgi:hypothetical protein